MLYQGIAMHFTSRDLEILSKLLETYQAIAEVGDPSGAMRDEVAHLRRRIDHMAKVLADACPDNFMSKGPCPFDTDGDGNCGQKTCPHCSDIMEAYVALPARSIYVATVE